MQLARLQRRPGAAVGPRPGLLEGQHLAPAAHPHQQQAKDVLADCRGMHAARGGDHRPLRAHQPSRDDTLRARATESDPAQPRREYEEVVRRIKGAEDVGFRMGRERLAEGRARDEEGMLRAEGRAQTGAICLIEGKVADEEAGKRWDSGGIRHCGTSEA